jgi:hypothetical protein
LYEELGNDAKEKFLQIGNDAKEKFLEIGWTLFLR